MRTWNHFSNKPIFERTMMEGAGLEQRLDDIHDTQPGDLPDVAPPESLQQIMTHIVETTVVRPEDN